MGEFDIRVADVNGTKNLMRVHLAKLPDDISQKKNLRLQLIDAKVVHIDNANTVSDLTRRSAIQVTEPEPEEPAQIPETIYITVPHTDLPQQPEEPPPLSVIQDGITYEVEASSTRTSWNVWNMFFKTHTHDVTVEGSPYTWLSDFDKYNKETGEYIGPESIPLTDGTTVSGEWIKFKMPYPSMTINRIFMRTPAINASFAENVVTLISPDGVNWTKRAEGYLGYNNRIFDADIESNNVSYVMIICVNGPIHNQFSRVSFDEVLIYGNISAIITEENPR